MALSFSLNDAERAYLGRVIRLSIESVLAGKIAACPPEPSENTDVKGQAGMSRSCSGMKPCVPEPEHCSDEIR